VNANPSKKLPKFRIHKATGQAYVELSGQRFYLGRHDRPEAQQKYHAMVAEWLAAGRQLRVEAYLSYVEFKRERSPSRT